MSEAHDVLTDRGSFWQKHRAAEQGNVAVMFVAVLLTIFGFCAFALDLPQLYNRKAEMQAVADTLALAAAKKLDGTAVGVTNALDAARSALVDLRYRYNSRTMTWSDEAIQFSDRPDRGGNWRDAGTAGGAADGLMYVKIDTSKLNSAYGKVDMMFIRILKPSMLSVNVSDTAVAGRSRVNVSPLGICAMQPLAPRAQRVNGGTPELVEYGFRRGVSYDLLNLNPNATTPAHFLIDPLAMPGGAGSNFAIATVGPYVCAGTMAVPKVTGGAVRVQSGFPIASLSSQLNSRFEQYTGSLCDPNAAPPDTNIKPYPRTGIGWMNTALTSQSAASYSSATPAFLATIADLPPPPAGTAQAAAAFGPLWTFARPVHWSATPGGEIRFDPTQAQWNLLYATAPTLRVTSYPTADPTAKPTPYYDGAYTTPPSYAHWPGVQFRRVLNVPLLQCPVAGSSATVLAIGKFFMTVPATSSAIYAEFAGVTTDQQLGGPVELYP